MSSAAVQESALHATSDARFLEAARAKLAPVRSEYPFTSRVHHVRGARLHYIDEGPRAAPPIVCVHGNPTWSFAFRRIVRAFSATHRVIAIDHLGCGLSEKPRDGEYTLARHAENLTSLVRALDLRDVTLVMHDWGGAIGMGFARREPERIARLFAMNTAAFRSSAMPLRIRACRWPAIGPFLVQRLNAFAGLAPRMAMAHPHNLAPLARRGLLLPYDTSDARIAIQRFVEDIPMSSAHPSWNELVAIEESLASFADRPVALCWGERDWCFTPAFREEWQRRFPAAHVTRCDDAGHYVFEEAPAAIEQSLRELLGRAT